MKLPGKNHPALWHTFGRLIEKFPDREHALALSRHWIALRDLAQKKKGHDLELPIGVGLSAAPFSAISRCKNCGYVASFTRPKKKLFGFGEIKYRVAGRRALGWRYMDCERAAVEVPAIKKEREQ